MFLPPPFCPISAARIGLKAITLLLILLFKSKLLRLKMSLPGSVLGFAMLVGFLITTGILTLVAGGAVAYAAHRTGATEPWHAVLNYFPVLAWPALALLAWRAEDCSGPSGQDLWLEHHPGGSGRPRQQSGAVNLSRRTTARTPSRINDGRNGGGGRVRALASATGSFPGGCLRRRRHLASPRPAWPGISRVWPSTSRRSSIARCSACCFWPVGAKPRLISDRKPYLLPHRSLRRQPLPSHQSR